MNPVKAQPLSSPVAKEPASAAAWGRRLGALLRSRSVLSLAAGFLIWELVGRYVVTSKILFAPFSEVIAVGVEMLLHEDLLAHVRLSLAEFLAGFGLAALAGIGVGILMTASRLVRDALEPWVSFFYSSPLVALMPFYILVFGIGLMSKVAIVFTVSVFPILLNTVTGLRSTDSHLLEVARAFNCNRRQIYTKVMLPSALPFIVVGLRLGVGRGLTGVVVGELFSSQAGLGNIIAMAGQSFETATLLMGVLVFSLIGVFLMQALTWGEQALTPWRTLERKERG